MNEIPLAEYRQQIERAIADGRYNEAVAHGKHILAHYPKDLETHSLLGQAMLEAGQDEEATEMFQRVLSADPERLSAWVALAQITEREGDLETAIGYQERAFELASDNADVARALRRLRREWEGREPERLQLTPEALTRLYLRSDLLSRAVTELRKLLEDKPDRVDLRVALAEALWRSGRRQEASEVCREILDQQPDNLKANLILGEIWTSSGQEQGLLYLERAEALDPENRLAQEFFEAPSPLPAWEPHISPAEVDADAEVEDPTALMQTQELLSGDETIVMALPGAPTSAEPVPAWLREIADRVAEPPPAAEPPEPELAEEEPPAPPEDQLEPALLEDHPEPTVPEDRVEPAPLEDHPESAPPDDLAGPPPPEDHIAPTPPDDHMEPAPALERAADDDLDEQEPLEWLAELAAEETAVEEPDEPVPHEPADEIPVPLAEAEVETEAGEPDEPAPHEPADEIPVPVAEAGVAPAEAEPAVDAAPVDDGEIEPKEFDDDEFDDDELEADDLERDERPEGLHPADIPEWLQGLAPADRVVTSGPGPEALAALLNGETFTPLDLDDELDLQTALEREGLTSGDDVLAWLEELSQEETADLHAQTEAEREARTDAVDAPAVPPPPPPADELDAEEILAEIEPPPAPDEATALDDWDESAELAVQTEAEREVRTDTLDAPAVAPPPPPADELDAEEILAEIEPPPAPDEATAFDDWDESAEFAVQTEAEGEARTDAIADGPPPPTGDAVEAPAVPPPPPPADVLDAEEILAEVEPPPPPDEATAFDDWDESAELPAWLEGTVPELDEPATEMEAAIAAAAGAPFEDWDDTTELTDWLDVDELPSQEDALSWLEKLGEEAEAEALEEAPPERRELEPTEPPVPPEEPAPAPVKPDIEREELAPEVEGVAPATDVEEAPPEDLQGFLEGRRRYVEEHPDDHEARLELGRVLWQADNRDEAIQTYDTLIHQGALLDEIIPDLEDYASQWSHPSVQRALGDAYARADRLQDALHVYRQALKDL